MKGTKTMKQCLIFSLTLLLLAGFAQANVWIDESFEDSPAFNDVDTYSYDPPAPAAVINHSGALSTAKAFGGSSQSYLLTAGQSISLGTAAKLSNGPFHYHQFAVNVAAIPAAGTMATLQVDWVFDVTPVSFRLDFVSTGSAVNLVAGESLHLATSTVIDTISDTNTWKFITLQVQKNMTGEDDPDLSQTGVAQGGYFYSSSATPQASFPLGLSFLYVAELTDWSLTVNSGSLHVDDFYWEGGMTDSSVIANRNLRDPATGTPLGVDDWLQY